ncbi:hypothetical protein GCM10017771_71980 [Streptomyces capitiformicae]|uniref:Uncharacterized protein n=1 Tax=Streptomyces capitiformicae TaxID=2014920 RepID=A0A918ZGJ6_9ACTN|nr:hypothetical protein GCM10017771_71980 [Streptomyces capitiformicae]
MPESEYGTRSSAGVLIHRIPGRPPRVDRAQYVVWSPDGGRLAVPADQKRVVRCRTPPAFISFMAATVEAASGAMLSGH